MNVRLATSEDRNVWDIYVDSHPAAAPYCRMAWKDAVEHVYGHKAYYLLAEEDNKITGIFPLFHFRIPFCGSTMVSLPYCDIGDVLADDDKTQQALLTESMAMAAKLKIKALDIRSCQETLLGQVSCPWPISVQTSKVRMLLDLPESSEELWKSFKSKLRSQVKKAEKNDLTFRWGDIADLDDFYHVFSRNMHALGSPVHSKAWIRNILVHYGENARMGLVFKDKLPVGGGIILCTKHRVSIPWASTRREFNRLSPNMMLYWNFLKFAADNGKKVFDFGRSTVNEGTYRFKKQWGAEPQTLYWYQARHGQEQERQTTGERRKYAALVWEKMPEIMVDFLGPKLRRYISL